jgi:hypothetical protein
MIDSYFVPCRFVSLAAQKKGTTWPCGGGVKVGLRQCARPLVAKTAGIQGTSAWAMPVLSEARVMAVQHAAQGQSLKTADL